MREREREEKFRNGCSELTEEANEEKESELSKKVGVLAERKGER